MAVLEGNTLLVEVEVATVMTLLGEGTSYDNTRSNTTTTVRTFGGGKRTSSSRGDTTYSVTTLATDDDAAQQALLVAERAAAEINIHVMPDGLNGFVVPVKVSSTKHSARADSGFQEITFDMTEAGDPVADAAGGFII